MGHLCPTIGQTVPYTHDKSDAQPVALADTGEVEIDCHSHGQCSIRPDGAVVGVQAEAPIPCPQDEEAVGNRRYEEPHATKSECGPLLVGERAYGESSE
eukprot:scaffold81102_cov32-Tisochrysis_lutea.AAC.1